MAPTQVRLAMALVGLVALSANRTVPKWQAFGNVSLDHSVKCVSYELGRFGKVTQKTGEVPEAGSRRLYLQSDSGSKERRAVIYLDGDSGFSAMWMDAKNQAFGNRIWTKIIARCGVA